MKSKGLAKAMLWVTLALLPTGKAIAERALIGTWSPDRQVAVAHEATPDSVSRCFFRDQQTGADLGEVPLSNPRPANGRVYMKSAWNYGGTRVALVMSTDKGATFDLRIFTRGADGHFQMENLRWPDPIALYQRRTGKKLARSRGDCEEIDFGPWKDDDTLLLALGKKRPIGEADRHIHYFAECKVRFRAGHSAVTDVRLKAPLADAAMADYAHLSISNYFVSKEEVVPYEPDHTAPRSPATAQPVAPERIIVGHDTVAEEAMGGYSLEHDLEEYREDFGRFPAGDNRAIIRQLAGLNPKHKTYGPGLAGSLTFDRVGNFVDPWYEPYRIEFHSGKARVYSRRLELARADVKGKRQYESSYDPLYFPTKADAERGECYRLALGIRLAVQRTGRVLSRREWVRELYGKPRGNFWPVICPADRYAGNPLNDSWGSPYQVKVSAAGVEVRSVHLPGEVYAEPFTESARALGKAF